ncbi:MAG: GNAT family N-acetyltransferase [Christensenellales bacterium]|jgi:acetyl esterase/lipase
MSEIPQLKMRLHMKEKIPQRLYSDDFSVHTLEEGGDRVWEWIVGASFRTNVSFSSMRNDPAFRPERVFFTRQYAQDIATASAFFREGAGYLHMVATHPWCAGFGAGRSAVIAALGYFWDNGAFDVFLTTDDFRLPAIHEYLELGFVPDCEGDDTAQGRWDAVFENLARHEKTAHAPIECIPETGVTMKPFPVEGSKSAVIVCPGGAYRFRASHEGDPICRMLQSAGISAYRLDYRLTPNPISVPLEDAKRAIRTLRHMGYEKVGILGFSAGGHLACMAAVHHDSGDPNAKDPVERESSRPDAFLPCYPLVTLMEPKDPEELAFVETLLGKGATESDREAFSAERNVTPDTPPAFIWHTAEDAVVPPQVHTLPLAAKLAENSVPYALHIFARGAHGLGLAGGTEAGEWTDLAVQWLREQGF